MQVDLVYFEGCPHVTATRDRLAFALKSLSHPAEWREWNTSDATTPSHLLGYASPTVLVDGVDVELKARTSGAGCAVGGGPDIAALLRAPAAAAD